MEVLGLFRNVICREIWVVDRHDVSYSHHLFYLPRFLCRQLEMLWQPTFLWGSWGAFQTSPPVAARLSSRSPLAYLTTYVNLCWITGQLIGISRLASFG